MTKDPQTSYVEAFEYLAAVPVNQYTTRYTVSSGSAHQIQNSSVVENLLYPLSAAQAVPRAQIDAGLKTLDDLARRYPQFTTLFGASTSRLRAVPTQAVAAITPRSSGSPTPATPASLTLRDGTHYQDFTILHADGDRFTIRYSKGIAEVMLRDLSADPKGLPPDVQSLLKTFQDKMAKAESERKARQDRLAKAESDQRRTQSDLAASISVPNQSSVPTDPTSARTPANGRARKPLLPGLTIKGICIGMDGAEAAKALVDQGNGKLEMRPMPAFLKQDGFAIYRKADNRYNTALVGRLCTDPNDKTVVNILIQSLLSDLLFNTADQTPEEFAQSFINAYGIPTITPTGAGPTRAWSYESSEGWTLYVYPDKSVQILRVPDRKFN